MKKPRQPAKASGRRKSPRPSRPAAPAYSGLVGDIGQLIQAARHTAARTVNSLMTPTYWEIGRRIVEFEQGGEKRAGFGEELLARLGVDLTLRFGRGFSRPNLIGEDIERMKSRLHRIEMSNFKAFRDFKLNLEGRHLLVYGPNGSGKSSLYWALYTFLQSARKPTPDVAKYFDPANPQNLLNIHEQSEPIPKPGEIALTLRDATTKNDTTYHISQATHGTHKQPVVLRGDLASDFITYRFFFGFSHFRNSEEFNLWPLFEKEILPFCVSAGGQVPLEMWQRIKDGEPNPKWHSSYAGQDAYSNFTKNTEAFAAVLPGIVDAISAQAQRFYDTHFAADDVAKITLKLGLTTKPLATGTNKQEFEFTIPEIEFGIQMDGQTVSRPQSHLNEAKMTQLALSVRFAASLVNLHESDLKLLVLDDLLVSLDMSNRMKVVEILLTDSSLADYQKIVFTHDRGLFEEFRRMVGTMHSEWCFRMLQGNPKDGIDPKEEKTLLRRRPTISTGTTWKQRPSNCERPPRTPPKVT